MHRFFLKLVGLSMLLCLTAQPAASQALKVSSIITPELSLGSVAVVHIDGLNSAPKAGTPKLSDFVLYLDGYAVSRGADRGLTNVAADQLAFSLQRTADNAGAWKKLLGSPTSLKESVQVDVGVVGAKAMLQTSDGKPRQATLVIIRPWGLVLGIIFVFALLCVLLVIGKGSDLLRDSQPVSFGGAVGPNNTQLRRTFSLAQTQMAWWFTLVIGAYIFLFLITGDVNTLTSQALILMGIGAGTALGAATIERTKTDPVQKNFQDVLSRIEQLQAAGAAPTVLDPVIAQRNQLARRLASENFFIDTLTDTDGISLHRFQILAWTIVIGIIFCVEVYRNLALPAFDNTILAILGISAGTYLGFKVPEQPT